MRILILILVAFTGLSSPSMAQHKQPREGSSGSTPDITSDKKSAEIKQLIEQSKARQRQADKYNSDLWERWGYAVCIGCGWTPKNVRIVHTNPTRVLAGIPAAEDDARGRSASVFRDEVDIGRLPIHEAKQQSLTRREHVASTTPW